MLVCKERPATLPPLDSIGLKPVDRTHAMSRGSAHHRPSIAISPSRQASVGLGFTPSALGKSGANNIFSMGNFATMGAGGKLSSEKRYANSNRAASVSGAPGMQYISGFNNMNQMQNLDPVVPLQASENRWDRKAIKVDQDSPELVEHKVKGLLNKLTMEKYASISDQIIAWANNSEKEKDGRTLIQVIRLVFEKATDEATWSEIYARLCRKMMEQISTNVQDDGIKNPEGKPMRGGQLFRKYLLNLCQEEFELGWVAKEAKAAAAATKALEDEAVKAANAKIKEGGTEIVLYSDEYYAAQKIKRQRRGLIKFLVNFSSCRCLRNVSCTNV
jgi:translation initiation factor 4G